MRKAFQILELIATCDQGFGVSDLSKRLRISKSTVHGIVTALEEVGAVVRGGRSKRCFLGPTFLDLGRVACSRIDLAEVARPFMQELLAKTRESVFIGARAGDHVSILEVVESTQDLKITAPVGTRIPLLAGATGKIFLASLEEDQAAELVRSLGLHRFTAKTITDPKRYLEEIDRVRRVGYATDDEEYISGVRAVAAPIRAGHRLSAIWVVGFTPSLNAEKLTLLARETKLAAEAIGRRMQLQAAPAEKARP